MAYDLKVGDKGMIAVKITRIDEQWITFTISGYAHPLTFVQAGDGGDGTCRANAEQEGRGAQGPPEQIAGLLRQCAASDAISVAVRRRNLKHPA